MKITAEPRSDQLNADDLIGSSRIVTIAGVRAGTAEQKYDIMLAGETRVWRPPVTVVRILLAAWGDESDVWVGRSAARARAPPGRGGPAPPGGIRGRARSHIDKRMSVAVQEKRGKRKMHVVEVLTDVPAPTAEVPTLADAQIDAATTTDELRGMWSAATPEQQQRIKARVAEMGES